MGDCIQGQSSTEVTQMDDGSLSMCVSSWLTVSALNSLFSWCLLQLHDILINSKKYGMATCYQYMRRPENVPAKRRNLSRGEIVLTCVVLYGTVLMWLYVLA